MYSNRGIRFAKLAVVIFVASHWACCGWFFAGDVGVVPGADGVSTVNGWASAKFNDTSVINKATMYFQSYLFAGPARSLEAYRLTITILFKYNYNIIIFW